MNFDDIEALIRKYLSTGMAVIVILVAPGTGGEAPTTDEPPAVVVEPDSTGPPDHIGEPGPPLSEPFGPPEPAGPEPDEATEQAPDPTEEPPVGEPEDLPDYEPPRILSPPRDTDDPAMDDPAEREDAEPLDEAGTDDGPADEKGEDPGRPAEDDEDTADDPTEPGPADTGDIDPDLDARGPADGAEPGIDEDDNADANGTGDNEADENGSDEIGTGGTTTGEGNTAAEQHGWGAPDQEDDFTAGSTDWDVYDGPGHAGEGARSPDALTIEDSDVLVITGDPSGTTGGLSWGQGQRYGRWEGRVRAPESDPSYNALMLLWPDAEDFPVGGEIDFMEMLDPTRQTTDFFLHHGEDNQQINAQVRIDATRWHNWAVEWTPDAITGYVDGEEWFRNTDPSTFPPGPMHLCIQLDWFPDGAAEVRESRMEVDWVRQWSLDETAGSLDDPAGSEPATVAPAGTAAGSDGAFVDVVRRLFSWR